MTRAYLDTSALRHLLVPHKASESVRARILDQGSIVASSEMTVTELHRFAARVPQLSVGQVDAVLDNIDLVTLTREQLRAAGLLPDLAAGTQLRSLDALHIQAALDFGASEFVTSDRRQGEAATGIGLAVVLL